MPRVSVVIPYFNGHATIDETLASLQAQDYRDFDVTVVDDGSTDPAAREHLDRLPPTLRLLRQANRGLPAARNAGIAASTAPLVLPLDCDDLLSPAAIGRLAAALDARPDAALAFSWTQRFGAEAGLSQMTLHPLEQLFVNEAPYCMLMRREAIVAAGGYDETMRDGYEDWEFNIRLLAHGARAAIVREALFLYRVREGGMLRAHSMRRHVELWRSIHARHRRLYAPRALIGAWRGARVASIWPVPALLAWGLLLRFMPAPLFNPAYRALLTLTRGWRDRYKLRAHGAR